MLVYFLMGLSGGGSLAGTFPSLLMDLGLLGLGLLAYGGAVRLGRGPFKRPLVIGLVFVFGWEQLALVIPGYLRHLTVSYYLQSLVPHAVMAEGVLSLLQSLVQQKASLPAAWPCWSPSARSSFSWRCASLPAGNTSSSSRTAAAGLARGCPMTVP